MMILWKRCAVVNSIASTAILDLIMMLIVINAVKRINLRLGRNLKMISFTYKLIGKS